MTAERLEHFRNLLLNERRRIEALRNDQTTDRESSLDGVADEGDLSRSDIDKDLAFDLGERETHQLFEIDEALRRIDDGTYGTCLRCGKPIDEQRLEAVPTARYHAECQEKLEMSEGLETPTL